MHGIISIDYLRNGQALYDWVKKKKKKRYLVPHKVKKKKIYQDNLWLHTSTDSMAKIMELKFQLPSLFARFWL